MIEFNCFVQMLDSYAKQYTRKQLKQLYVEVQKLAEVLLAIHKSKWANDGDRAATPLLVDGSKSMTVTKAQRER